ncbi:PLC-like phosphodiesterase [Xylaria arbuscula]|nr:PLC-like phosphodiesterase [Xylaria arbuscula]
MRFPSGGGRLPSRSARRGVGFAYLLLTVFTVFTIFLVLVDGVAGIEAGSNALGQFALDRLLLDARDIFGGGDGDEGYFLSEDEKGGEEEVAAAAGRRREIGGVEEDEEEDEEDDDGYDAKLLVAYNARMYDSYGHGHGYAYNKYARWMAQIPNDTPVTQLTIPGTHDAATWNYTQTTQDSLLNLTRACDGGITPKPARVYRCQKKSLAQSLAAGVRFFDLRFAMDPLDTRIAFWHGPALLSGVAEMKDVLFALYDWLDGHPSEFVMLSLQYETGTREGVGSDQGVQRGLFRALTDRVARRYVVQERGWLGDLGSVRGKIVLFRRFDLDKLPPEYEAAMPGLHMSPVKWTDNSRGFELVYNETTAAAAAAGSSSDSDSDTGTAFIEDFYHPDNATTVAENIDAKFDAVERHLRQAAAIMDTETGKVKVKDGLFVTFTSGTHVEIDPPVYPEVMALGSAGPPAVRGINERLKDLLGELKGQRLGVVVMDFFEEPGDLIDLLLGF